MLLLLPMSAVYAQHTEDTEHEPVYFIITSTTVGRYISQFPKT